MPEHIIPQHEVEPMALRAAALSLLNSEQVRESTHPLTRKAGSFLGQCAADPQPLTTAQADWLNKLLKRAGFPPFGEKGR